MSNIFGRYIIDSTWKLYIKILIKIFKLVFISKFVFFFYVRLEYRVKQ